MSVKFYNCGVLIIGLILINASESYAARDGRNNARNKDFWIRKERVVTTERLKRKLDENQIAPDVIDSIPVNITNLKIIFPNGVEAKLGNELTPTQVLETPSQVKWKTEDNALYTLCMTDPDAPSRRKPNAREWLHWLIVNIPANRLNDGDVLAEYVGSAPPNGSGLHRYVFLVYKQPNRLNTDEPKLTNKSSAGRAKFRIKNFAQKYNLGEPVAANFYLAKWDDYVPLIYQQLNG